jgi:hypothetical protein
MIALGSVFLATLLSPEAAIAARSGGRVGGSSFRSSAPSMSRSMPRSMPRSNPAPRTSTRLYSSPSTTINKTYVYGGSHAGFGYHPFGYSPFGFSPFGGYYSYFPIHNNNLYLGLNFADSILRAIERQQYLEA